MTRYRHYALVRLALIFLALILVGTACSLSSGNKKGSESRPTIPATITPPLTRTPIPTFTAFPTLTPFQGGGFQPVPTATRIALAPNVIYYTPFPTWTPAGAAATAYPYDVRISYPVDGSTIAGYVTIVGSASHPRFLQYALEWGPDPNPGNLWYPITSPQTHPVINGALGAVNTMQTSDGVYQIRLHIWLNDGTETFDVVTGIHISNRAPTAVPTLTPTPRPNRSPVVSPIPSQEVDAGATITLPVSSSDPDGDAVNLFVASSNNAIATAVVTSTTSIDVTGVTAGVATIAVTANDNRGGLATTAFIVTVKGQNQAPTISPILEQAVAVGQTFDVPIAVSDADGDPLTVTAASENGAVVTATAPNTSTVSLIGTGIGSANVTVAVNDGKGGVINTTFRVDVGEPNRPPTINTIPAQTLAVGQTLDVPYFANDPDGDPITADAGSDTPGVVTATITAPGNIRLVAVSAGPATVSVSVSDGTLVTVSTFPVTVVMGNVAPTIDPIAPQTMSVGETRDVPYNAIDPENDPLNEQVSSDNPGVVTAAISVSGTITLNAVSAGVATVTLTVNDGHNPAVSMPFTVSVAAVNLPPAIETIFPQTLNVGASVDVGYTATDPDNDPLAADVSSDNPGVVTAFVSAPGVITLSGVGAGNATVTLTISDGHNPAVSMPFSVSVIMPNSPPTINPIGPQAFNVGMSVDVGYIATDPDNDPLAADVSSDNTGVVTAFVSAPGTITLTGVGAGSANVTLTVSDGINPAVSMPFAVTVAAVNSAPTIAPIGPQAFNVGTSVGVGYSATDPDNDPLTADVSSDNPGVVTAFVSAPGTITLTGVGAGSANVTLTVSDGINPAVSMPFAVTVAAVNSAPTIAPIGPQALNVGTTLDVGYSATDPDNDPLTADVNSDNPGVVTAFVSSPGVITLTGVGAGNATVTLTVSDGFNAPVSMPFAVTVAAVNNNPIVQPINPQSVNVGSVLPVPVQASDPDGDPITLSAVSDNPGVATAVGNGPAEADVTGVNPGTANVTVYLDDGRGGTAGTSFQVTVVGVNNPPVIQPIADQSVTAGAQISVPVSVFDPDGDPITLTALSENMGVVTAESFGTDTIVLTGAGAGVTAVDVTADDARGGVTTIAFTVTVSSPAPSFDLMAYPVLPDISGGMAQSLQQLYQSAVANYGVQGGAFSKVGGAGMSGPNFLVPFGTPGQYDLSGRDLQGTIDFFSTTPVRPSVDPSINSFTVDSAAASDAEFNADQLMASVVVDPICQGVGSSPLTCEFSLTRPSIALISFDASNVIYMDPSVFRSTLQSMVSTSMTQYGVIPVLATIPATDSVSTEQLTEYNRAIVEVATQFGGTGLPLWNLWRAMHERGITNPLSVAPEGPGSLTDSALNYGYNVRNLTALQVLKSVRQAANIN
jgi:hypothetical protein